MKTLYLVRHAKAGWQDPSQADFNRTLTNRGHAEAELMSTHLFRQGIAPELLVSSPARRALETAEIFAEAMGVPPDEIVRKIEIYEGGLEALAGIVRQLHDDQGTVMLFGHNPTISHFVQWLTGKPADAMETCGVTKIELEGERWQDTAESGGTLDWYEYPEKA